MLRIGRRLTLLGFDATFFLIAAFGAVVPALADDNES